MINSSAVAMPMVPKMMIREYCRWINRISRTDTTDRIMKLEIRMEERISRRLRIVPSRNFLEKWEVMIQIKRKTSREER